MPHDHDASRDHGKRPWWKSFRVTAAIGYCARHFTGPWNRMAVDHAGIRAGDRVVDIGCGPGESSLLAARAAPGVEVIAADPAWPCCFAAWGRSRAPGIRVKVRRSSAEALAVPDRWATVALSVNAFHHWADPRRGLAEARRVLGSGGRLVLVDEDFPEDHRHTRFHHEHGDRPAVHAGSPEVRRWLRDLGFEERRLERVEDAEGTPHHLLRARTPERRPPGRHRGPDCAGA